MSFFTANRRFYSTPSPSATNLIQPTSQVCHSHRSSSSPSSPPLATLRPQQEPVCHTFYIREGSTQPPRFLSRPANLQFPSSRFHQTPPHGAPTSHLSLRNQTTTFTTPTHGAIESLTEASTYSLTEASLMSVVFSSFVLVSWPYCVYIPPIRPFSLR